MRAGLSGDFDYESFTSHTMGTDVGPITFFIFIIFSQVRPPALVLVSRCSGFLRCVETLGVVLGFGC